MSDGGVLAIDIGSSRVKLGWFPPTGACVADQAAATLPIAAPQLPQPAETLAVSHRDPAALWTQIGAWLQATCPAGPPAYVASVHPAALASLQEMFAHRLQALSASDLPLEVQVPQVESVGIDRLLNAVAVNQLRAPGCAAVVIDLGTACTVDLITTDGAFAGGAILPGIALAASSLHTGTASLPQLSLDDLASPPEVVGKSTRAAMLAGLYWGNVGAVRELAARLAGPGASTPQRFVTGGGAPQLVELLGSDSQPARHIPHLVLSGIAMVAKELG
jgi:type III pantothenate kinase